MRKKNNNKRDITKKLLIWILASGGIVVLSLLAPQLPYQLLKSYLRHKSNLQKRLDDLEKRGWIKVEKQGNEVIVKLVKKGKLQIQKYQIDDLKIEKPEKWDGKWRIVIFDIPDKKKLAREVLRNKLNELGFRSLQKSVFVLPYPCKKEIEVIKSVYEIWPYVNFITADEIDNQKKLINKFNL